MKKWDPQDHYTLPLEKPKDDEMNSYLKILYGAIKQAIKKRHPYDEDLIGLIAEMFLDFNKEVIVQSSARRVKING